MVNGYNKTGLSALLSTLTTLLLLVNYVEFVQGAGYAILSNQSFKEYYSLGWCFFDGAVDGYYIFTYDQDTNQTILTTYQDPTCTTEAATYTFNPGVIYNGTTTVSVDISINYPSFPHNTTMFHSIYTHEDYAYYGIYTLQGECVAQSLLDSATSYQTIKCLPDGSTYCEYYQTKDCQNTVDPGFTYPPQNECGSEGYCLVESCTLYN